MRRPPAQKKISKTVFLYWNGFHFNRICPWSKFQPGRFETRCTQFLAGSGSFVCLACRVTFLCWKLWRLADPSWTRLRKCQIQRPIDRAHAAMHHCCMLLSNTHQVINGILCLNFSLRKEGVLTQIVRRFLFKCNVFNMSHNLCVILYVMSVKCAVEVSWRKSCVDTDCQKIAFWTSDKNSKDAQMNRKMEQVSTNLT